MPEMILGLSVLVGLGLLATALRTRKIRQASLGRLFTEEVAQEEAPPREPVRERRILRRRVHVPVLVGVGVAALLLLVIPSVFALTLGLIAGILAFLADDFRVERQAFLIERQLADSIDLMVSSLRAGAGLMDSLDTAVREARRPLRPQIEELLVRIRYGDDPQDVLRELQDRIPLEAFRLFSLSQSVHWEVGGSLANTLSMVGRFIRDRVEVRRHTQTQTTQTRVSMIAIMFISYFIALVMWRSDPERWANFITSTAGSYVASLALLLQAGGLVWITRLSKIRY